MCGNPGYLIKISSIYSVWLVFNNPHTRLICRKMDGYFLLTDQMTISGGRNRANASSMISTAWQAASVIATLQIPTLLVLPIPANQRVLSRVAQLENC